MDPDTSNYSLQRKVMFDIWYFFCCGGNENMHSMSKSTFELVYDEEIKITYLKRKQDETTKNHKETNSEIITGYMLQILDQNGHPHQLCPIHSYKNYINHVHDDCEYLWQTPIPNLANPLYDKWYKREQAHHNILEKFMGNLSKLCQLSQHYTIHCIHVTAVTTLCRNNFSLKQIMSVIGHNSIQSLGMYHRVKSDKKMMMGVSLTCGLMMPGELLQVANNIEKIANPQTTPIAQPAPLLAI